MTEKKGFSLEEIGKFLEGRDPQERIVNLDYKYQDDFITVIYRNENDQKCAERQQFYPFLWATRKACLKLAEIGRTELQRLMQKYGIACKRLSNTNIDGKVIDNFNNGYLFMFYAIRPMSYTKFLNFFKEAKNPVYKDKKDNNGNNNPVSDEESRQYLVVSPQEQFLIQTGKRFFKGYDDYDDLLRMIFDLETEGLNPRKDRIKLNGVKLNRPVTINGKEYKDWGRIFKLQGNTKEELDRSELEIIITMIKLICTFKPDIVTAHNGENFDWNFIIVRCEELGYSLEELSKQFFNNEGIRKETKPSVLKLGGEIEEFHRTIVPYTIVTDSLHAVRRAQATDSNFLKADLKYSTDYLGLKKENRVYTPGAEIDQILTDKEHQYAFNDTDGDWYVFDQTSPNGPDIPFKKGKDGDKPFIKYTRNYLAEGYVLVTGEYIIERYLLDDLWECDKVEHRLNTTNFLICKILPVPYGKCTTMGTAGQWKAIMLAWSYENNLAIPMAEDTGAFTGGISRCLVLGEVENVIKLDYNSLYPSIILTWGISDENDLMNTMLQMLEYVLTTREKYKKLKGAAKNKADSIKERLHNQDYSGKEERHTLNEDMENALAEFSFNDKKQNQMKVLGNSFFGSYGSNSGAVFPFKSAKCAEQTTCTGRQCLRLMISHFHDLGYQPIVGDSVTGDTPLFIRYKENGYIDIKPISEIMDENVAEVDYLGRKYDTSEKPYQVLCRSGWKDIDYVYSHETTKDIYEVTDGVSQIEVTEDHSLFNDKQEKIKPSEINSSTKLEYYKGEINHAVMGTNFDDVIIKEFARQLAHGTIDRVPYAVLNGCGRTKKIFYREFIKNQRETITYTKTCLAGIQYLTKK